MKTKEDISYGVIPIRKEDGEWKVLLVNQFSRFGNKIFWGFPKGHSEEREEPKQTAARELREETNVVAETIEEPLFDIEYSFVFDGIQTNKKVVFFIGIVEQENFNIDGSEIKEAGWFSLTEASKRLDYEDAKEMFSKAVKYIETL